MLHWYLRSFFMSVAMAKLLCRQLALTRRICPRPSLQKQSNRLHPAFSLSEPILSDPSIPGPNSLARRIHMLSWPVRPWNLRSPSSSPKFLHAEAAAEDALETAPTDVSDRPGTGSGDACIDPIDERDVHAASMALEAYLQRPFKVYLSDAVVVVEGAPLFVRKLVNLTIQGLKEKPRGQCPNLNHKKVLSFLKSSGINILEPVLESLDMVGDRAQAMLSKLSTEPKDVQALNMVIRKFYRLGIPRSKVGEMLEKDLGILSYSEQEIQDGAQTLRKLGVSDEVIVSLIQKFPFVLKPQVATNVNHILEELKQLPEKDDIVRNVVCQLPAWVHKFSEGGAKDVVKFLQKLGVSQTQVSSLLLKHLAFVVADVNKIKVNAEFLMELGVSKDHMSKVITRCPSLLFYSLQDNIRVKLDYFKSLGFSDSDMAKIIVRYPNIFSVSLENKVKPALDELRNLGLSKESVRKIVLYRPSLFGFKLGGDVSMLIEDLKKLNCSEKKKVTAFIKLYSRGSQQQVRTEAALVQHGLSAEEARDIVEKQPDILGYNEKALARKVENLTRNLGLPVQSLLTAPEYLSFGLKRSVHRRMKVLVHLKSKGLLENELTLKDLVGPSNHKFFKTFVQPHSKASDIHKVWFVKRAGAELLNDPDVLKGSFKES